VRGKREEADEKQRANTRKQKHSNRGMYDSENLHLIILRLMTPLLGKGAPVAPTDSSGSSSRKKN
jgi:hypothetical protein